MTSAGLASAAIVVVASAVSTVLTSSLQAASPERASTDRTTARRDRIARPLSVEGELRGDPTPERDTAPGLAGRSARSRGTTADQATVNSCFMPSMKWGLSVLPPGALSRKHAMPYL